MRHLERFWVVLGLVLLLAPPALAENYAILFSGGIDSTHNYVRYYDNTLRMYNLTVGNLNFRPENVWVLAADGLNPNADRDDGVNSDWSSVVNKGSTVLSGTHDNLQSVLQDLPTGPADMLYLWTFDHGNGAAGYESRGITNEEQLCGWGANNVINDDELGSWVHDLSCGRQAFVFTQCYSGGLVDDLGIADGQNRFAAAATNHYEESYFDGFAKAFADGMSGNLKYTKAYDLYQYAYENDEYATKGEGPGGVWYDNVEHPWKIGDNLDLAVAKWVSDQGGEAGQRWSRGENWNLSPNADRTVRIDLGGGSRTCWIDGDHQAGYLVADWHVGPAEFSSVILQGKDEVLHSQHQVIGDKDYGCFFQSNGLNDVAKTLWLANIAGSTSLYTMSGGKLTADRIVVGNGGTAQFQQTGGKVEANFLDLGSLAGGSGTYTMSNGCTLTIGDETVGAAGAGSFTQSGGEHSVSNLLALGGGSFALGGGKLTTGRVELRDADAAFEQSGGTHKVTNWMLVDGGAYRVSGGLTTADHIWVRDGGLLKLTGGNVGTNYLKLSDDSTVFTLDDGNMGIGKLDLDSGATFNWNGGNLFINGDVAQSAGSTYNGDLAIKPNFTFTYNGGTFNGRLFNGGAVTLNADFAPSNGLVNLATMSIPGGRSVDLTGGGLANIGTMTQMGELHALHEYIGDLPGAGGKFTQFDGANHVDDKLIVGFSGLDGTYRLASLFLSSPQLTVDTEIRVGADNGKGRFEWVNGVIQTPTFTLGAEGTLAIAFDFTMDDLSSGKLFVDEKTKVQGLDVGTVEVILDATASLDGGSINLGSMRLGNDSSGGTMVQSGGANNARYMEVNPTGRYEYSGGSLNIADGGLHVAGEMDFANRPVLLTVMNNALVNLTTATVRNAYNASLQVLGTDCLTILPPGFDTHQFGSYVNNGRTHTAGSTLVIAAPENYTFQGHIADHVQCHGVLAATENGYINLDDGLEVEAGGSVDLGDGVLTVNDAASHLANGGNMAAGVMQIGAGGSGSFAQYGGAQNIRDILVIGRDAGDVGAYDLHGGNMFSAGIVTVGLQGGGTLRIINSDLTFVVFRKLHFGADSAFEAALGSMIHMAGSALENENTDPLDLPGLSNLTLIYEGGADTIDPFEVAGAHDGGFADNFALGAMILGGGDVGKVRLVDLSDNGRRTSEFDECLFVSHLIINPGSSLDLNGLDLYVAGNAVDLLKGYIDDGGIYDSMCRPLDALYDPGHDWTYVPEPATLSLLALGSLAMLRRRR